jgi:hypothetical protein
VDWYKTEVNKGDINMRALENDLNKKRDEGYRLAHILEQADNIVMIFEKVN